MSYWGSTGSIAGAAGRLSRRSSAHHVPPSTEHFDRLSILFFGFHRQLHVFVETREARRYPGALGGRDRRAVHRAHDHRRLDWGRPTWGVWWTWDARLTLTAILLLIYTGYLMLRSLIEDESRAASAAAVLGIIGFLDIPLIHMSVYWWRTLHQPPSILQPDKAPWENVHPADAHRFDHQFRRLSCCFIFIYYRCAIGSAKCAEEIKAQRLARGG